MVKLRRTSHESNLIQVFSGIRFDSYEVRRLTMAFIFNKSNCLWRAIEDFRSAWNFNEVDSYKKFFVALLKLKTKVNNRNWSKYVLIAEPYNISTVVFVLKKLKISAY